MSNLSSIGLSVHDPQQMESLMERLVIETLLATTETAPEVDQLSMIRAWLVGRPLVAPPPPAERGWLAPLLLGR